jgi:hypothetical protein
VFLSFVQEVLMRRISQLLAGVMLPFLACVSTTQTPETSSELLPKAQPNQSEKELALQGLRADDATAKLAGAQLVSMGEDVIPELRALTKDPDPKIQARAREVLGYITGQWGGGEGIVWKKSVNAAKNQTKPIMVLHLFGKFDEEIC